MPHTDKRKKCSDTNQTNDLVKEQLLQTKSSLVDDFKRYINSHPLFAPIIIFGIVVIGIGSFTDSIKKIEDFIEPIITKNIEANTQELILTNAFAFGKEYIKSYFLFSQGTVGSEKTVTKSQKESLEMLKPAQNLADSLGLKTNLLALNSKPYKEAKGIQSTIKFKSHEEISKTIEELHGSRAAAAFRLGFILPWLIFNSSISIDKAQTYTPEDIEQFSRTYNILVIMANSDMGRVGINNTFLWDGVDYKQLNSNAENAWSAAKSKFSEIK